MEERTASISSPSNKKLVETLLFASLSLYWIVWSYPRIKLPEKLPETKDADRTGKKILLLLHVFFFGIEIGFKFATRQMIWILNPCHLVTMMQVSNSNNLIVNRMEYVFLEEDLT